MNEIVKKFYEELKIFIKSLPDNENAIGLTFAFNCGIIITLNTIIESEKLSSKNRQEVIQLIKEKVAKIEQSIKFCEFMKERLKNAKN